MKHLAFNLLMLVGMTSAAQLDFANKKYTYKTQNGYGVEREVVFKLVCTKEEIMNCKDYWKYIKEAKEEGTNVDTLSDDKLCEYFIMNFVGVGIIDGKYKLKKPMSLDFITESIGMLYVANNKDSRDISSDLANTFNASLNIKAQNGYGQYTYGKFMINEKKAMIFMD